MKNWRLKKTIFGAALLGVIFFYYFWAAEPPTVVAPSESSDGIKGAKGFESTGSTRR